MRCFLAILLLVCQKKGPDMQTRIDKFGRIVIPKSIRQNLGLRPGEIMQLEEQGEKIILKPDTNEESLKLKDGILVFSGKIEGDITNILKEERSKRIHHLSLSQ